MKRTIRYAVAASAFAATLSCMPASAATIVVNVAGVQSIDNRGSANNVVNTYNIGSGSLITDIAYNISITSYSTSWVSEIALFFGNSARTNGLIFTPGFGDEFSGNATYAGTVNLVALGLNTVVGADGLLRLEYFEEFNDFAGAADGIWNSGTITFTYSPTISAAVPESATWAMMLAGFGLIGSGMRRRSAVKARVTYA